MARKVQILFCRIDGSPVYEDEALLIVLCIFGLTAAEIAKYLHVSEDEVKKMKSSLFTRLNVPNVQRLNHKAERFGFDLFGNYHGNPVLSARELKMLFGICPWLKEELRPAA